MDEVAWQEFIWYGLLAPGVFFAIRSFVADGDKLDLEGCGKSRDETVLVPIGC